MENFVAYNPTKLHFGKGVLNKLGRLIKPLGKKVMLIYGGGSIKRNGIYDMVIEQLNGIGVEIVEYGGITPNPVVEDVDAAAELGRKNNVDVILAVGGGSVIDAAKIVSIAIPVPNTAWDFYDDKIKPEKSIPLIAVLTLAATGTEMNPFAVVQNNKTRQKLGYGNDLLFPVHSLLDPALTTTVPVDYTAYGIADLMAHCLEAFFGKGDASLPDRFIYAIMQEAITYGPPLLEDLTNYDLREKIMYAATCALNRMTLHGRVSGDWGVHSIGHVLSLLYHVPHGASLSIVYPAWLRFHQDIIPERIMEMGKNVFGVNTAEETILVLEDFFKKIGCPVRLSEWGIGHEKTEEILDTMNVYEMVGDHYHIFPSQYREVVNLFL